ncbi:MAG: Glu-tRNA(Gln) amidotransferase subunit GatE [Thaumarchaeota archaeon]|nr:Glu-tRNA(Gln) amidotransferase subunit GatE [Nitrososphaerota archaeon]
MSEVEIERIGLKVGLEIHQQLGTGRKLFCNCASIESTDYPIKFTRRLRMARSELGELDPSALFETTKQKTILYYANPESSCLVEQDEEPPHDLSGEAKETSLIIASALNTNIFSEVYVMRKLVIDGSNTSGFQRTMLLGLGGSLEVEGKSVGVQSICLEEDAAKLLNDSGDIREYTLDRLGIPLIEIALEPVSGTPQEIKKIALAIGRLLRATKRVQRGLGSIRQDVNVSIEGGGVVEVKGVQKLDQLEKVIEYEAKRQHGLKIIQERLQKLGTERVAKERDVRDVTEAFRDCKSKTIQKALAGGSSVRGVRVVNFAGMFGFEPYPGIRLGKQLGELVRFFGLGGVFHSDELPNYGITDGEIIRVREILEAGENDGFLVLAGEPRNLDVVIDSLIKRIEEAKAGVPAETRVATLTGETVYLRPRPGASRMYPETDIPPIIITKEDMDGARRMIPKSWEESLLDLQKQYELNPQLALQIFDSEYLDLFESVCNDGRISPNFASSVLCGTITNLERQGLDSRLLKNSEIAKAFEFLADGRIAKESLEIIFGSIMGGKAGSVEEAIRKSELGVMGDDELGRILEDLVTANADMVDQQKERSIGALMGIAMKDLRGKVDGQRLNKMLEAKIKSKIGMGKPE